MSETANAEQASFEKEAERLTKQIIKSFEALRAVHNDPSQAVALLKIAEQVTYTAMYRTSSSPSNGTGTADCAASTASEL